MSTVPITGVGDVIINPHESTSTKLLEDYLKWMEQIQDIFNQPGKPPYTLDDYEQLQQAMQALKKLALEGDKTSIGAPYYMPLDMLSKLNAVFASLNAYGIGPDSNLPIDQALERMAALQTWEGKGPNDETVTFSMILSNALGGLSGANKSLQSMLYLEFVLSTTARYEKKLTDLENQLKIIKDISDALANLQDWRNKFISAPNAPEWNNGEKIPPTILEPSPEDIEKLKQYLEKLEGELEKLDPKGELRGEEGTLANSLKKIIDDLQFAKNPEGIVDNTKNWLLDNQDKVSKESGQYQDHLTKAIAAAQSLNETEKENLRSIQYDYEQFMKIATSLMQIITKIIEKPAQAIGR